MKRRVRVQVEEVKANAEALACRETLAIEVRNAQNKRSRGIGESAWAGSDS